MYAIAKVQFVNVCIAAQNDGGDFVFYEQLNKACAIKGMKLTPLIKELGMSQGNLSRWKNGGSPTADIVSALAEKLNVSADYLLGITDNPVPTDKKIASSVNTDEAIMIYARDRLGREPTPEDIATIHSAVDIAIKHLGNQRK